LRAFAAKFGPKGGVMAVVGKFDPDAMSKLIESKLSKWQGGEAFARTTFESAISARGLRKDIHLEGKDAISISIGQPCPLSSDMPDRLAARLANAALGGDTLSSRLGWQIRERRGLTYGVYSRFVDDAGGGAPWMMEMSTDLANLERSIGLMQRIARQYGEQGVGELELAEEKASMAAATALSLDGPSMLSATLARMQYMGDPLANLDTFEQRLFAVTKDEVDAAIRKYLNPDNCVTVVAGTLGESPAAAVASEAQPAAESDASPANGDTE
jgi:zinc protease